MDMAYHLLPSNDHMEVSTVFSETDASVLEGEVIHQLAGYRLKMTESWPESKAAYQLRAKIYDSELSWSCANNGMEADVFDQYACSYVVVAPTDEVVATFRILSWQDPWMATECYEGRFAREAKLFQTPLTQEISRLCIAQTHRDNKILNGHSVLDLVLKGILNIGRRNGSRYSYFITRLAMKRALVRRGFVIPYSSSSNNMPDGCTITSLLVDNYESDVEFKLADQDAH